MLKGLGVLLLLVLTAPEPPSPLMPAELEELREQARHSHLVVEATVIEPYVTIEKPELRRPTLRRGTNGESLEHVKLPGDHVVGWLSRFQIDVVLKPDGHAVAGSAIEVVMPLRDAWPWNDVGERYVLFLQRPFRLHGQDVSTGWRTLEGTTLRDRLTGRDVPFLAAEAYGSSPGPSMFSRTAWLSMQITPENAPLVQTARQQVALTIDDMVPSVTLHAPAEAAQFVRGAAGLAADASDNVGIRDVEWLLEPHGLPPDIPVDAAKPVTLPVSSPPYSATWATTQFPDGRYVLWTKATDFAGNVGLGRRDITIDNTPPRVILRAEPQEIWGSTGAMVPIQIDVQLLTDNLDASPSIRLVQVTASQPMAAGDVADATLGTDDRSLAVRATCVGLQRVYTIVFEGTDRAGNVAQATTTVTIIRDLPPPPEPEDPLPPGE